MSLGRDGVDVVILGAHRAALWGCLSEDGRLETAGASSRIAGRESLWAVPGLIDCHDHLAFKSALWADGPEASSLMGDLMRADAARMADEFDASAARVLTTGTTTVRDFGVDHGAARYAATARDPRHPRIVPGSVPLGIPGGHLNHRARAVTTAEEVHRALAEDFERAPFAWVKLFASGGIANYPHDAITVELSTELMRAAVEFAADHGLRVAAHALPTEAVRNALDAGVDSIEHGVFLDDDCVRQMAAAGVWYVPTFAGYTGRLAALRSAGNDAAAAEFERTVIAPHVASVHRAVDAGVRVLMGTDITADVVGEMAALMEGVAMSFDQVLWGATVGAAQLLGLDDGTGRLGPNARADVILVEEDPRLDVTALRRPVAVYRDGALVHSRWHDAPDRLELV